VTNAKGYSHVFLHGEGIVHAAVAMTVASLKFVRNGLVVWMVAKLKARQVMVIIGLVLLAIAANMLRGLI
jgi:hypothetical protein